MLTAQDTSYDEARNLHSKWLKHQAFMAELASNKEWLNKVDQVWKNRVVSTYRHETVLMCTELPSVLLEQLCTNTKQNNNLISKKTIRDPRSALIYLVFGRKLYFKGLIHPK